MLSLTGERYLLRARVVLIASMTQSNKWQARGEMAQGLDGQGDKADKANKANEQGAKNKHFPAAVLCDYKSMNTSRPTNEKVAANIL